VMGPARYAASFPRKGHGVVRGRTRVGIGVAGGKAVCGGSLGSH